MSDKCRDTSNDVAMSAKDFREWLREHDLKTQDVAEMLGVTNQAAIYWIEGKRKIPEPVGRILIFLGQRPQMMREF